MGHEIQVRKLGNANGLAMDYADDGTVSFSGASGLWSDFK